MTAFKDGGHDGVIAFGGGSGLDLGKLLAFMAGQTRPVWDFEDIGDWWTREIDAIAPIVAVPTTAGTGSEVGRAGVITNEATHIKKIIFHPKLLPAMVIADPELTVGMPPFITAAPAWTPWPIAWKPIRRPAIIRCRPASRSKACVSSSKIPAQAAYKEGHLGPRQHDGRGGRRRRRLPEGPRCDPCAVASNRRALRHPSRHDQRRLHADVLGSTARPSKNRIARAAAYLGISRAASTVLPKRSSSSGRNSRSRTRCPS